VPLYREHEVIGRGTLKSFDDAILGTAGHDPQAVPNGTGGLVMAGVDRQLVQVSFPFPNDIRQSGIRGNFYVVGHGNLASGFVVDR